MIICNCGHDDVLSVGHHVTIFRGGQHKNCVVTLTRREKERRIRDLDVGEGKRDCLGVVISKPQASSLVMIVYFFHVSQ